MTEQKQDRKCERTVGEGKAEGKGAAIWGLISCGVLAPKTCHQTNKIDTASSAELIRVPELAEMCGLRSRRSCHPPIHHLAAASRGQKLCWSKAR